MLSLFIANLTYSIIDNIVILSILWLVYDVMKVLFKVATQNKFLLALSFQILGTLYFWIELFSDSAFHFSQYLNASSLFTNLNFSILSFSNTESYALINTVITIVYLVILTLLLVKYFVQYGALRKLKNSSNLFNNDYYELLLKTLNTPIKEKLKIGLHKEIDTPIVFGVLEHIILLPFSICNQIPQQAIKMILLHEYAHIIRKDYFINLMIELNSRLLWFNPFVYFFKKEMNLQREIACDEFVITYLNNPIIYSKALLNVAEGSIRHKQSLSLAAYSNSTDLKTRIEHINGIHKRSSQKMPIVIGILMISSLCFVNTFKLMRVLKPNKMEVTVSNTKHLDRLALRKIVTLNIKKKSKGKSNPSIANLPLNANKIVKIVNPAIEKELAYNDILNQTKNWIKSHENPVSYSSYNENYSLLSKDSTEDALANKLLLLSILKNYQLKKAIFENKVKNFANGASNKNEAMDYLLNSKEWNEMVQYEKWVQEFLQRQ